MGLDKCSGPDASMVKTDNFMIKILLLLAFMIENTA